MKPEVTIDFSDLRQATTRVLAFAEKFVQEKNFNLRTSIAEDLSLVELDGYVFLDQFQTDFKVTLPQAAYDYVTPYNVKVNGIQKVFYSLTMILFMPVFFLFYPFMPSDSQEKVRDKIRFNKKRLTLGDLAVTVAAGHFLKREDVIISTNLT